MRLILLSGGSGKRLWPLSNDVRSKQFLKVLENDNGKRESMVQRVWRQLNNEHLADKTLIATSVNQVEMIQSQLGENIKIVVEPERRDTYPAIALSASYLFLNENVDLNEVVVVLPVDPFVEDLFFKRVKELEKALLSSNAEIALLGVRPSFPSEKFGYIVPFPAQDEYDNIQDQTLIRVKRFCEKPNEERARSLLQEHALWNCGVFAFKLGYVISNLKSLGMPTNYSELRKKYSDLPKISFDYEVVEKAQSVVALSYEGQWKDLGTWNALTEEISSSVIGKAKLSDDSKNTHIINELDIPIIVLGVSNAIVTACPDGILFSDKSASPRLKDMTREFEHRPMFEERRWGWYRVLDHTKYEDDAEVLTKRIGLTAGKNLSYQIHNKRSEIWTIVRGEGQFVLNDQIFDVCAGDVLNVPVGAKHGIKAITDLEIIEVQIGSVLVEEDIIRIYMSWDDVLKNCIL